MVDTLRAKEFGGEIKALRLKKKMGLRALARACNISSTYLTYIEQGLHGPPSVDKVKKLAEVLEDNPDRLLRIAGHLDPEIVEWLKNRQEKIGPAVRNSQEKGNSWFSGSQGALLLLTIAVIMDRIRAARDGETEQSFEITPPELYAQLRDNTADEGIEAQRKFATLLAQTGQIWINELDVIEHGVGSH